MQAPSESDRGGTTAPPDGAARATPFGASPERPARNPVALARLALVALVVLAALGAYAWYDLRRDAQQFRAEAAERLTNADTALTEARARESDLANALRDAQAKITLLEARLAESQSQQAALETLYRELAPSRDELALTEVEQVLTLAGQQLTLGGNVQAALAGVQLADAKLARMDRPRFAPLRRALARDMDRLKAVPYVDVAGISIKLDQLIGIVDSLPLAKDERLPAPAPLEAPREDPAWIRFLRDVWNDVRNVVRVEVSDRPAAPLLTPSQSFFLRENLRLRLLSARLALLSRDARAFRADIDAANAWLRQYFDIQSKPVQVALATLAQNAAVPMQGDVPDLSESIDAVRALKAASDRAPEASAPRAR